MRKPLWRFIEWFLGYAGTGCFGVQVLAFYVTIHHRPNWVLYFLWVSFVACALFAFDYWKWERKERRAGRF